MATRSSGFRILLGGFTGGCCGGFGSLVIPNQILPILVDARILDPKVAGTIDFYWVLSGCPAAAAIGVVLGIYIVHRRLVWEEGQQTRDLEQTEHGEPRAPATGTGEMETGAQAGRRGPRDSVDIGRNQSAAARGGAVLGWLLGFLLLGAALLLGQLIDVPKEIERYSCLIPLVVAIATTWIFTSMQSRVDAQALQANCEYVLRRFEEGERDLAGVSLYRADLVGIDLRGASLKGANLAGVDLSETKLRNGDLREANLLGADLRNADLQKADLRGARLEEADLEGADLSWAKLHGAALSRANLRKADLLRTLLCDADLRDVDLRGARLLRANLKGADWEGANREGADLDRAILPDGTKHE